MYVLVLLSWLLYVWQVSGSENDYQENRKNPSFDWNASNEDIYLTAVKITTKIKYIYIYIRIFQMRRYIFSTKSVERELTDMRSPWNMWIWTVQYTAYIIAYHEVHQTNTIEHVNRAYTKRAAALPINKLRSRFIEEKEDGKESNASRFIFINTV